MTTRKWQQQAARGGEVDQLRRAVIAAIQMRLDGLGLSRESLGLRAGLGGSYVHQMVAGRLDPTLRSIARLVAVMDRIDGTDDRTATVVRGLCETVDDAQSWVHAARQRLQGADRRPQPTMAAPASMANLATLRPPNKRGVAAGVDA